jgi:hypothetical protein
MNKPQNYMTWKPDFELERSKIENFLLSFVDRHVESHHIHDQRKYMIALVRFKL